MYDYKIRDYIDLQHKDGRRIFGHITEVSPTGIVIDGTDIVKFEQINWVHKNGIGRRNKKLST